jgi:hypothetical protein
MSEIIDNVEKIMKSNIDSIGNCIIEFSNLNKRHTEDLIYHIDKLNKEVVEMQL